MKASKSIEESALSGVRRSLFLTRLGMIAERLFRAFWPFWTVCLFAIAALALGLQDMLVLELLWGLLVLTVLLLVGTLVAGIRRFRFPRRHEVLARLDETLPGRPIAALTDKQAIGADDGASIAVWHAHVKRMKDRVRSARPARPDLRLSHRDRFGLRYIAATLVVTALLFGSVWRAASVADLAPGLDGQTIAQGPSWEGWIEPPAYTGQPSLYLNDIDDPALRIPAGSRLSLRLYGQVGAHSVTEDISTTGRLPQDDQASYETVITQSGTLTLDGPQGRSWTILTVEDKSPNVSLSAKMEFPTGGEMRQPFYAQDDYGVISGTAVITLDLNAVSRRYGLAPAPEVTEPLTFDLPMPIRGDRNGFEETLIERFEDHVWSGLPVTMTLTVEDALGQTGQSAETEFALPGRRFFDALAGAVVEQRRDLLWSLENGARAAQVIRAVTYLPEGFVKNEGAYLILRVALRRLEAANETGLTPEARDEVADMLWEAALLFEEGDLSSALERLRRAQDQLAEAMRNGASDEEIAELMQELREAMQDYMRELAEQNQRDGQEQQQAENTQQITGDQLEQMLQRLQELMEQGRMAEAQQLMDQLRQMMENMQVTQNQQGQQGQNAGQEAMEGLADTLREQQGLSDQAFRDLQEQFNQGAQAGQSGQNEGRDGGRGRGEAHDGTGQTPGGEQQGEEGNAQSLADRQNALRQELDRQRQNLPGASTEGGQRAREALGRAGDAMDRAEDALRDGNNADALDNQADAMEALREGMRELGNAMAEQQQQNQGQQQGTTDNANSRNSRDPLGRQAGNRGRVGTDEELTGSDDVYRRARELLDEIRKRSGEQSRPDQELEYLRRLLDRF